MTITVLHQTWLDGSQQYFSFHFIALSDRTYTAQTCMHESPAVRCSQLHMCIRASTQIHASMQGNK